MTTSSLSLALSPEGRVHIDLHPNDSALLDPLKADKIRSIFANDPITGLLHLGLQNIN